MTADTAEDPRRARTLAAELGAFALGLEHGSIPEPVRDRAKHLILDAVGLAFASKAYPFASAALGALSALGPGSAPVIGIGRCLSTRDAAVMNGILVHGLGLDDVHSRGTVHATASSFPCAFAVAEQCSRSGEALLVAYVVAMEVSTRLASAAKGGFQDAGFHATGLVGSFGATLAAARLLDLTPDKAEMAQGIALSMASGTLQFLDDGAWTKRLHPGWAASAGITAATLAHHGFIGSRGAYEGRFGLYSTHLRAPASSADLALATEGLGRSWQIEEVAIKPMPASQMAHAAADAAIALSRTGRIAEHNVRSVRVLLPAGAVKMICEPVASKRRPASGYDAQFSIQYIVATGLLRGRFTLDELEDEALRDPEVLALTGRVEYEIDPVPAVPGRHSGEVVVEFETGEKLYHREPTNRGGVDRPLSNADIEAKYLENATRSVSRGDAARAMEAVLALDTHPAVDLAAALLPRS